MLHNLTGWHALIILAIVLLIFGSSKLPALAKSVGQSVRILKDETHEAKKDDETTTAAPQAVTVPAAVTPVQSVSTGQSLAGHSVLTETGATRSAS